MPPIARWQTAEPFADSLAPPVPAGASQQRAARPAGSGRPGPVAALGQAPCIAFLTLSGGSYEGGPIRDLRLAAELQRRGFRVLVYWVMERNPALLPAGIRDRLLCRGVRFLRRRPLRVGDFLARHLDRLSAEQHHAMGQARPVALRRVLANFCDVLSQPGTGDPALVRRLERLMIRDGVTTLVAGSAIVAPLAEAVAARGRHAFDWVTSFQGEDLFTQYARDAAARSAFHARIRDLVAAAPHPALVVSRAFGQHLQAEMGLAEDRLATLHPSIDLAAPLDRGAARASLRHLLPALDDSRPLVAFVGRQDSEKGVDLLLYAMALLRQRGLDPQLLVCGPTLHGRGYGDALRAIAGHLRLEVLWLEGQPRNVCDQIFAASRCVVYPSVHLEAFGMVAAEAMAQGTPVVVPDRGGLVEATGDGLRRGGLLFKPWDSAHLAQQIERLLRDDVLHGKLAAAARPLAERFDGRRITDRFLQLLGLPATPGGH